MTREEIIKELEDIRSAIEYDGELVAEDSLDALADRLMTEGSEDVSEKELDAINEMIYGSFIDPETICVELINMLMSGKVRVDEDIDPFTDDIWDDEDIDWDAMAEEAEQVGKPNFAEFPDHEFQEACEGGECKEELKQTTPTVKDYTKEEAMEIIKADGALLAEYEELLPYYENGDLDHSFKYGNFFNLSEDESKVVIQWMKSEEESTQLIVDSLEVAIVTINDIEAADGDLTGFEVYNDLTEETELAEGHFRDDSIIDGDIPGKVNGFEELITMRFHNLGYDYYTHPLYHGNKNDSWNPYKENSFVMYGPTQDFFDKIVSYIESEVNNEGSAWWNRKYQVVEVTDKYNKLGKWALCIYAEEYDRDDVDLLPDDIKAEYARRRKIRRSTKSAA